MLWALPSAVCAVQAAPADLMVETGVEPTADHPPFKTKKIVCGLTLIGQT